MKLHKWKSFKNQDDTMLTTVADLLLERECGTAVRWEHLEMIPLFKGPGIPGQFAPPENALRLAKVTDYGEMVLENRHKLPTIVPLHLGYFQNAAQNHAMCVSAILEPKESREFKDACCIQEAQGGYIHAADERFIILPQALRDKALALRGVKDYAKLWDDISRFNHQLGLKQRGHLDELKRTYQPALLETVYHLEPYPEQTGALFLCDNTIMGIELAPDPAFWADLHTPLLMYCYAPLRLLNHVKGTSPWMGESLSIEHLEHLDDLQSRWLTLKDHRQNRVNQFMGELRTLPIIYKQVEEQQAQNTLLTIETKEFTGQMVLQKDKPVYVSLSRKNDV